LTEGHRHSRCRVVVVDLDRSCRVIKETRVTEIVCKLPAEFDTAEDRMLYRTCMRVICEVGLIEQISPFGCIIVCSQRDEGLSRIYSTRNIILITAVVVAVRSPVEQIQLAELTFEGTGQ
jgi:hypothetical protein